MASVETDGSVAGVAMQHSDAKRQLLERRLRGKRNASRLDEIPPRPAGESPMSFGQERLWFQSQVADNPSLFNIAFLAQIDGPLDIGALEASVNGVISRHEALRAGFINDEGAPRQFFAPVTWLQIRRIDLTDAAEKALSQMRARAQTEARAPFSLASPPLMRVTLFKLAPSRYALLFVVHHIVWDGWSSGVFIEEITKLYQANRAGDERPLAPQTTQYADFAHWHRTLIASDVGARQVAYWRERLAGLPELISLPTDRARQARQTHEGAVHEWNIPAETLHRIATLARRHNVTQFAVLLAAYNVLLMHYSGERDIAIGTAMAYRTRSALERLIGFFANVVAIRTPLDDDPTFETLIIRTQQSSVEAQSNQDLPFDLLVERLAPKRGLSHHPLFQVAFVQHHLPIEELIIGDLRINFENLDTGAAIFDLVLHIYSEAPGLKASFEFNAHLFDARTIRSMAAHFSALIDHLLDSPDKPVSRVRLLEAREEARTIARSGAVLAPDHAGALLQNVLDGAAPDAVAVDCGHERLTYAELADRSNRLGHYLRTHGVEPDMPVALLLDPSVDMIVALFGVLKAGGAYLPLDPAYPQQRIQSILNDSGARILVTTSAYVETAAPADVKIVVLDRLTDALAACPSDSPASRAREDNLAYFIYTSGSTGLSKGVMISHRSAVASTRAREQFYKDRVAAFLLLSSISFDSSVAGIFWTLAQGGALRIASEYERREPGALARIISTSKISHLLCLPSFHDALLDVADADAFASLRCCIVAGEACRPELAERHFRALPDVELVNEYGPTECTVWSTAHRVARPDSGRSIPVGRPIPGAQALILGAGGAPQPQGAPGELCVGGVGLARGYAGRPDLTAERFRPNPFGAPGEQIYQTGDRARLNADGDIVFLGRLDEQLKIRGYRVDPREIESVMLQRSEVRDCIVLAKTAANGAVRLSAYCQTVEGACGETELKRHASERLPAFMRPDIFVRLDQLPRLPNGKVDRNALPEPAAAPSTAAENEEPENASLIEVLLADIWRDVLGAPQVRSADNFFDLGGNSLAAMQVVARAQRTLGREIPVGALFESSDLSAFAKTVQSTLGPDFENEIAALLSQIEAEAAVSD